MNRIKEAEKYYKGPVSVLIVMVAIFAVFFFWERWSDKVKEQKDQAHHDAFYAGVLGDNPLPLQNSFLEDIKNGVNDKYTKSDAFFVTHRFFDNGGDIYEIYNYVNAHPELAFLKEAEQIYPDIFQQIKDGTLPHPHEFSHSSYYAYMAYVETLIKHGYNDVAAEGTLANQYAKTAFYDASIAQEMTPATRSTRTKNVSRDAMKAIEFLKMSNQNVADIINGKVTSNDITPRDILVGLNQYAAALRYIEALQNASSTEFSIKKSKEIFDYTMMYARKNVPELYLFTSLLNASTLAITNNHNANDVRAALYPWIELDVAKIKYNKQSVVFKVLNSRLEQQPVNIGDTGLDIYSKRNTVRLADQDPAFKAWLVKNGWKDSDFNLKK